MKKGGSLYMEMFMYSAVGKVKGTPLVIIQFFLAYVLFFQFLCTFFCFFRRISKNSYFHSQINFTYEENLLFGFEFVSYFFINGTTAVR